MLKIFDLVDAVADSRTTVLMTGESGTGKSLLARAIHHRSPRRDKPFVEVSCGALPETLLESELFGHVKGAFTGAIADKPGRFMAADGGTIFLDEINSASPAMQVKLLRVLQERAFEPVGSSETRTVDVRVILASNVDLAALVAEQTIPAGPVLPHQRREHPPAEPARAARRHRAAGRRISCGSSRRRSGREILGFTEAAMAAHAAIQLAGQRARAGECGRAGGGAVPPAADRRGRSARDRSSSYPPTTLRSRHAIDAECHATADAAGGRAGRAGAADHRSRPLKRNDWNRQATAAELDINRTTLYKKMRKYRLDVGEMNTTITPGSDRKSA